MSGFITRYPAQPSSSGTPGPTTTPSKNVTSPPKDDKLNTNIAATYAPPSHHNTKFQIDENAAAKAMQFLIVSQLRNAGFDSGEPEVLITIERLVGSYICRLAEAAHEYADLSGRSSPNGHDLFAACELLGVDAQDLKQTAKQIRKTRKSSNVKAPTIKSPPPAPKKIRLLASDSEGESNEDENTAESKNLKRATVAASKTQNHPTSLRQLPSHFPALPPKHTYLRTDAPRPTTTTLTSLQQKIDNAAIIQNSLRNLIQQTEVAPARAQPSPRRDDSMDWDSAHIQPAPSAPPPEELAVPAGLEGFVNWEAASGTRKMPKRWKV